MEQAIFTTMCMVYDDRNRILVQERVGTAWDGIAFPGGHVEHGESFVESVTREILEETGYLIETPRLCGVKQFQTKEDARYVIFLYKADRFQGNLRSSSEGRVFWIDKEKISDYKLARDMAETMELFETEEKSEFYYVSGGKGRAYKIL